MIWCRNASAANGLPYWATRFTYQIGQNAGSAAIRDRSLMNWSPPHYKQLSGAILNTILAIQHKRFEDYTLWHSENTEWPTTEGGPLPDPIQYRIQVTNLFCHIIVSNTDLLDKPFYQTVQPSGLIRRQRRVLVQS